ncbi:MAG: hypothetical protein DDT20_01826 [Firmicutes bacterium]|nr:hypothetical protein [Bacillota bacterium]
MVNKDRIREKIQLIKTNVADLRDIARVSERDFVENTILFHAATRMLQISIEAVLDIAQHIVTREQLGTPKTYREVILLLESAGIVPGDQVAALVNMTRFRNRVVHMYDEVSREEVHRIIMKNLSDFDAYLAAIVKFVWGEA